MRRTNLFRLSDPAEGNGKPTPDEASPDSPPSPPQHEQFSAPPPPAATTVTEGKRTEADVALELENKKLQTRIAQLEDERRAHVDAQRSHAPATSPATVQKKSWLAGGSFFE